MSVRDQFERRRSELIGSLRRTVLEIGAGRGANFGKLHPGVIWIGLEPDARSCTALARTAATHGHRTPPLVATCEEIPLATGSVSAVFETAVLCSVNDPEQALAEIARVLEPGGSFVFAEHVAAARSTGTRRFQETVSPLTRRFDCGCNPARETAESLRSHD